MTDERRKAAEEWATANFRHNPEGRDDGWQYEDYVVPAHLAGQECERDAVVRWLCSSPLYTDLAAAILRGEHRGGE